MSDTPREQFTGRHDQFVDHMERIDFPERELAEARAELEGLRGRIARQAETMRFFAEGYSKPEGDWEAGKLSGLENGAARLASLLEDRSDG